MSVWEIELIFLRIGIIGEPFSKWHNPPGYLSHEVSYLNTTLANEFDITINVVKIWKIFQQFSTYFIDFSIITA